MQSQVRQMVEKLETFPPERLTEVANFIDFFQRKAYDQNLTSDYAQASQASFMTVWNNDEDTIYDSL